MGKLYIIVADTGRLFRMEENSVGGEWFVFDDGRFEPYELPMDIVYGKSRVTTPRSGAQLVATFPGENKISQGRILEVYRKA